MAEESFKLFFSYSHKDESLRDELANHLAALKRQGVISSWHDRKILAGEQWDHQINDNLNTADIILLLVSSNFLASDYCWDVEVKKAIERHDKGEACVIPVILRPVDWTGAPFAKLQAVPKNAEPVVSRYWHSQDEAFTDVARGIRAAVEKLKQEREKSQRELEEVERWQQETEALQRQREEEAEKPLQNELASEKGVDYTRLRDLLAAKKWKEADYETYLVILQVVRDLSLENLLNFPSTDLSTIDCLWVKYSNGHFGFSIQREVYSNLSKKYHQKYDRSAWQSFCDQVGWRFQKDWIKYENINFNHSAPLGMFPCWFWGVWAVADEVCGGGVFGSLLLDFFSRVEICQLQTNFSNKLTISQISFETEKEATHTVVASEDNFSSESGVDYTKLRDLLAAKKWKEADYETYLVMLQVVGRKEGDWIRSEELLNFPCTDLRTIDQLWVKYSNGNFGFSVQKEIYLSVGGKPDGKYYSEPWGIFGDRVAWRVKGNWIYYSDVLTFDTFSPRGHLPTRCYRNLSVLFLFSRIETCEV